LQWLRKLPQQNEKKKEGKKEKKKRENRLRAYKKSQKGAHVSEIGCDR
jgi:hypothetical protein